MNNASNLMEALKETGPCDSETLASYTSQSESVVNAMLVNLMRKNIVKQADGLYQLTNPLVQTLMIKPAENTPPVTQGTKRKIEVLRDVLRNSGREMTTAELAEVTHDTVNNIGTRLKTDIKNGKVLTKTKEGTLVYQWMNTKERELTSLRPTDEPAIPDEIATQPKAPITGCLSVPTSDALRDKLIAIDDELVQVQTRLAYLTAHRKKKAELLILVGKIETLIEESE